MKPYNVFYHEVLELIAFSEECPYYFGLQSDVYGFAAGIADFPALQHSLNTLKKWARLSQENFLEETQADYNYIIHTLANKDFCTPKGNKSLHWPSQEYPHLVANLIEAGADVNAEDDYGNSPLMHTLTTQKTVDEQKRLVIVKALLAAGANIGQRVKADDAYPLRMAIEGGYALIVEAMLDAPQSAVHNMDPLLAHRAIKHGHTSILSILIKKGLPLDRTGITLDLDIEGPLVLPIIVQATILKQLDCVNVLLNAGVDPNATDSGGRSALIHALMKNCTLIALALLNGGAKIDLQGEELLLAVTKNNYTLAVALLAAGADVNQLSANKVTSIFHAACYGPKEMVQLLLKHHAHVNFADEHGQTPLWLAAINGHIDIVKALIDAGANTATLNFKNKDGDTPIITAATTGNGAMLELLIKHGADVNHQNNARLTALHYAARHENYQAALVLLNAGAKQIQGPSVLFTPLNIATSLGFTHTAEVLKMFQQGSPVKKRSREESHKVTITELTTFSSQARALTTFNGQRNILDDEDEDENTLESKFDGLTIDEESNRIVKKRKI